MLKKYLYFFFLSLLTQQAYAGGVSLGATRLVYPTSKDQVTLKIYNADDKSNYLVQSWISDENNKKVSDFIITPPLFVIKSGVDNLLKVVFTGDKESLPKDREKLYFLNTKVIPSLSEKEKEAENALLISTTTRIKVFIRPDSLKEDPIESYKSLICKYDSGAVNVSNPTPFYMNLVSLSVNGKQVSEAETIPPKSSVSLKSPTNGDFLSFNFINDYGVQIKQRKCKL